MVKQRPIYLTYEYTIFILMIATFQFYFIIPVLNKKSEIFGLLGMLQF